ncbi:S-adenosyl-L-methionine-dependent methyltransferase [Apiospora kogelbergensis]|uniref:S-adenosyl-L-methionine-dependent methyltransferase n=1 Tax=Apiospora kogelbergensis TaxID=1337665 RepID=A0AAW0REH7_9PEZI
MSPSSSSPRIVELASKIQSSVIQLQSILDAKGVPSPSFDENAPDRLPREATEAQDAVLDATQELYDLLLDSPAAVLKVTANNSIGSLGFISRFDLPNMVPLGGRLSFAEVAKKTGFAESVVARLLRDAMCVRIFHEPEHGMVAHTKTSKALRQPWLLAFIVDALEKWPNCEEPSQTSYNLVHKTEGSYFDNVAKDPERAARFAAGMAIQWELPGYQLEYLLDGYDWAGLGRAKVVDLGGFRGRISVALAERFPDLDLLVEDMGMNEQEAHAAVPAHLKPRVNFRVHDMFLPQPVSADVYYIRQVLHDWPDKYSIKVLRQQIPALKKGAKLLLNESLLPEAPGSSLPLWRERDLRTMDLGLIATMNGRERTLAEWKAMVAEADPRFKFQKVTETTGSMLAMLEWVWEP